MIKEENNMIINCTLADPNIKLPEYESKGAACVDLRAWKYAWPDDLKTDFEIIEGIWLRPMGRILIKTGLRIELLPGMEAQIRPRSGLAIKHGITVLNSPGCIDSDYRGDIGVILINLNSDPYLINRGDRVAQMSFHKVERIELRNKAKLSDTKRGDGGFCSTGIK